jgi:hypothetical protein
LRPLTFFPASNPAGRRHVEDRVENFAHIDGTLAPATSRGRDQRRNEYPFPARLEGIAQEKGTDIGNIERMARPVCKRFLR